MLSNFRLGSWPQTVGKTCKKPQKDLPEAPPEKPEIANKPVGEKATEKNCGRLKKNEEELQKSIMPSSS